MAPKFKGDSDDWLDDEKSGRGKNVRLRPKKAVHAKSVGLPFEQANAVVAEVFPNQCRVKLDSDHSEILCSYRRAQVVSKTKAEIRERTPVAVGDRVLVQVTGTDTGVIEGICERKNCISRVAPGRDSENFHHVLAANIDLLVIVAACQDPQFVPGIIDRFLVVAESEGVDAALCITKIDLSATEGHASEANPPWEIYKKYEYPVFEVSSTRSTGIEELKKHILGKTVVFCGHSGVGKTSLLRVLLEKEIGKIGQVNEQTGKGRHTTTGAVLLGGPDHSQWIDTPGVKEFGLSKITPKLLSQFFPEFRDLPCQKAGCQHWEETHCDARQQPRYLSYKRILADLLEPKK
jgi:ribosome biogenesis GTPase